METNELVWFFIAGVLVGGFIAVVSVFANNVDPDTAYTKGITDCQQGTTSYTVTVGPEGVDTTYVYKP